MKLVIISIDDLIRQHWGSTIVLQGETPEEYAIREEETRLWEAWKKRVPFLYLFEESLDV